jgi:PleD family two-component response regulator
VIVFVSASEEDEWTFRRIIGVEQPVVSVREVAEARAAITQYRPRIVVCDSNASGFESWRDLLALPESVSFALIVVSRQPDERLWAEVLNLGGYDVLATPLRRQEVERVMASALCHAASR